MVLAFADGKTVCQTAGFEHQTVLALAYIQRQEQEDILGCLQRTRLDASSASRTGIWPDHVSLPVTVDPCPEPVSERHAPPILDGQRANLYQFPRKSFKNQLKPSNLSKR